MPADAAPAAGTALALTWTRMRSGLRRHFIVVGALCLGIALLLTAMDGHGFGTKLVYSLSIGATCALIVDLTRLAAAWAVDRRRAARREQDRGSPAVVSWLGVVPGAVLALVAGPPIGLWLADWLTGNRSASLLDLAATSTRVTLVVCLVGTVISLAVLSSLERLASARAQAEAAQRQAAEHQLRLLQSQLEPHMLFNTLANLRVLIGLDTAQAQAMLDRLIAYLRATLSASRLAEHPLATEFDRIADYLALMGVRMGPRLHTQLVLPDALRPLPVPPLLLQPLVENAIKHGLEPHVQGGLISVEARAEGSQLVLTVRDTGVGLPGTLVDPPGSRFGLTQVRERLATLHGERASFTLEAAPDADGGTLATVRLPLALIEPAA